MEFDKVFDGIEYRLLCNFKNEIFNITHDSRCIEEDSCYICLIGKTDGHNFINEAIANGATTVIVQDDRVDAAQRFIKECGNNCKASFISVADTRGCYGKIANNFYSHPDRSIKLIGVTGTNGKTTTCKVVYDILRRMGYRSGLIGTVCNYIGSDKIESAMTTPDPMQFNELLRAMVNSGCEYAIAEISAHAIALRKLEGCRFAALGFTNLTRDHLDFFGSMDKYRAAKISLFDNTDCPAVINIDDECGTEILDKSDNRQVITYAVVNDSDYSNGIGNNVRLMKNNSYNTDICAVLDTNSPICDEYVISVGNQMINVKSGLCGKFNVYNTLCALGLLTALGHDEYEVVKALEFIEAPDGRFEMRAHKGINIVIDYAHTPDGMEKVLSEIRSFTSGKLYCVFGCGGERDKSKRPIMGSIAEKYSDKIILTSDNPRCENRTSIIEDIYSGINDGDKVVKCVVRYHAILYACKCAEIGDTIAVLGKGHENYIEENNVKIKYSDIESVEKALGMEWNANT